MRNYPKLTSEHHTYWIKQAKNGKGYRIFTEEFLIKKIEDGTIRPEDEIQLAQISYNSSLK